MHVVLILFSIFYINLPHDLIWGTYKVESKIFFLKEEDYFWHINSTCIFTNEQVKYNTIRMCSEVCEAVAFHLNIIFICNGNSIYIARLFVFLWVRIVHHLAQTYFASPGLARQTYRVRFVLVRCHNFLSGS